MKNKSITRLGIVLVAMFCLVPASFAQTKIPAQRVLVLPVSDRSSSQNWLISAIDHAKTSIHLTIYQLDDSGIMEALSRATKRGVAVRVLYNGRSFNLPGFPDPNVHTMPALSGNGVTVKPSGKKYFFTHQKTLTIDQSVSVIMTFNLSPSHFTGCRDFAVVTCNPTEVAEITRVFEADWEGKPVSTELESLVWSPDNARKKIVDLMNSARKTLEVYSQTLRDTECVKALIGAAGRGVKVRLISAALGNESGEADPKSKEIQKTLESHGVETRKLGKVYAHAKVIIADGGTPSARAFVGSQNFSATSLARNRELGIMVEYVPAISTLRDTFDADWNGNKK